MKSWLIVLAASVLLFGEAAAQVPGTRSSEVVSMAGTDYYLHRVAPGETVYSLSRLYGVAEERFYEDNPAVKEAGLKAGETVRVLCTDVPEIELSRRKMQRTFVTHTVQPGETTYSIAKRYSLAINTLIQDNPGARSVASEGRAGTAHPQVRDGQDLAAANPVADGRFCLDADGGVR
mgnify:CR=1 FL=1